MKMKMREGKKGRVLNTTREKGRLGALRISGRPRSSNIFNRAASHARTHERNETISRLAGVLGALTPPTSDTHIFEGSPPEIFIGADCKQYLHNFQYLLHYLLYENLPWIGDVI